MNRKESNPKIKDFKDTEMKIYCPLCSKDRVTLISFSHKSEYSHCHFCDLIYLSPHLTLSLEEEKRRYLLHDNSFYNKGYVKMLEVFLKEVVLPYVVKRDQALDFGCGPSPVLKALLEEEGFVVDIYDPFFFPKMERDKEYYLLTLTEVLEHIGKVSSIWQKLFDLLEPDGYLALMTSFHQGVKKFPNWWYRQDPTHQVFYSQKTFSYLQTLFSWEIIYTDQKKNLLFKKRPHEVK